MLCILSRRYPFFKAKDDTEALAQLITLFGTSRMKAMADSIGMFCALFFFLILHVVFNSRVSTNTQLCKI